jgi:rubrerythrin
MSFYEGFYTRPSQLLGRFPQHEWEDIMDIESALKTAIDYEKRVVETYQEALEGTSDPVGKRIFKLLQGEERDHVAYLESKLGAYRQDGALSSGDLGTRLPAPEQIRTAAEGLKETLGEADFKGELDMLKRARAVELETSAFYHRMVDELPEQGRAFFQRFVEIEEGHVTLVEAEIEYLQHKGAWLSVDDGDLRFF